MRLLDLQSDKGKLLNECVGEIIHDFIEGRFSVRVFTNTNDSDDGIICGDGGDGGDGTIVRKFKPMNMRVVCSSCHEDSGGQKFKVCSLCNIACYCDKDCQRHHWKKGQHKIHCPGNDAARKKKNANTNTNTSSDDTFIHGSNPCHHSPTGSDSTGSNVDKKLIEWDKSMDHPSWSKLIQPSRHNLRRIHEQAGCRIPWPVSVETPAMIDFKAPSFLIAHPNMKFRILGEQLGGQYNGSYVHKFMPILSEKIEMPIEEYFKKVPSHTPHIMTFAILAEVVWTKSCQEDMEFFFNDRKNAGAMFKWPGAECVGICPGTGKRVPYSFSKKHLLVVCNMQGNVFRGSGFHMLTRMMPRILTIEGYKKLLGPDKEDRSLNVKIASTTVSSEGFSNTSWKDDDKEFYPGQLRIMNADKPKWLTASMAYELFNTSGEYDLYDKYLQTKF